MSQLVEGKAYDAPAGWHWATAAEVEAVPGWDLKDMTLYYHGQGGWAGYLWEGVLRVHFAFRRSKMNLAGAPTADVTRAVDAGAAEGRVRAQVPRQHFAGIVYVQD
jgi:hypothetical protein